MTDVTFVTELPDKQHRAPGRLGTFVEALKANPGQWGVYSLRSPLSASTAAHALRKRYGCEAVQRKINGVVTVYARWNEPTP